MGKLNEAWVNAAFQEADLSNSKLDKFHNKIYGAASPRLLALINNLCAADNVNYLDLGSYRGATLLAATMGNPTATAVGVENYSYEQTEIRPNEPDGPGGIWEGMKNELSYHINRHNKETPDINPEATTLVEGDFAEVDYSKFPKFNLCFMDIFPNSPDTYDTFFEKVLPHLSHESVVIFAGVSDQDKMEIINKALLRHQDKFTEQYEVIRITHSMANHKHYYNGIRLIGLKKKLISTVKKAVTPKKVATPKKEA